MGTGGAGARGCRGRGFSGALAGRDALVITRAAARSQRSIPRASSALCAVIISKRAPDSQICRWERGTWHSHHQTLLFFVRLRPRNGSESEPLPRPAADYIRVVLVFLRGHERSRYAGIRVCWIIQRNCQSINKIVSIHTWKLYGFNNLVFASRRYLEVVPQPESIMRTCCLDGSGTCCDHSCIRIGLWNVSCKCCVIDLPFIL